MPNHLTYPLSAGGYVEHWLVLGPCAPGDEAPEPATEAPLELDRYACDEQELFWEVEHCGEDHLIDRSGAFATHARRRLWAFTRLACREAREATLWLTTTCPATLLLNGCPPSIPPVNPTGGKKKRAPEGALPSSPSPAPCAGEGWGGGLSSQVPITISLSISLRPGDNDLLVRLEQTGAGDAALAFALRLDDAQARERAFSDEIKVRVPTVTGTPKERIALEQAFAAASLDRAIYGREDPIRLLCHKEMAGGGVNWMRLQRPDGRIHVETEADLKPGAVITSVLGVQLPGGPMQAILMPPLGKFYNQKFRARRVLPFWVSTHPWSPAPGASGRHSPREQQGSGDVRARGDVRVRGDARLIELMQETARGDDPLYAELAKMALGWWRQVKPGAVHETLARIRRAEAGCLPDRVALLGMRRRMFHYESFPGDLRTAIDDCLLGFDSAPLAADQESDRGLLYACRILAGQAFPQATFPATGLSGEGQRRAGEAQMLAWLRRHGQTGFALWDAHLDQKVVALAHLADLAENTTIRELSAVLLDKLLFSLALHSFQGSLGGTRGEVSTAAARSGRLAPEAALNRLLWGTGCTNGTLKGAVSLGLARGSYELPSIIGQVALDRAPEMWSLEKEGPDAGRDAVHKVTYKTPDYLLSSAQDWRPGQRGRREQIWQATMGPDALVYTNHPTNCSLVEGRHAAWWCGNGALPRVAQWKDALIAVYRLPAEDWLGFTHAHWPGYAFDEHVLREGWAFARCGEAYLALTASRGLARIERGPDAYRELRALGSPVAWLCQMGRATVDGDFGSFQEGVLAAALPVAGTRVEGAHVEWATIRGDHLAFDWTGPLRINGREQPLSWDKHYDGPYAQAEMPATSMDVIYGEDVMRLDLS